LFKLGDFEFSKPPDVFKSNYGRRSSQFFVAGSLEKPEELSRLRKLVDTPQLQILDLVHELGRDRVFVNQSKFSSDAVGGIRYELVLEKFTPLKLLRRAIASNEVEDMGEKVFSPRFRVVVEYSNGHDELPRGRIIDYRVDLRVVLTKDGTAFSLGFIDQYPVVGARFNFSRWIKSPQIAVHVFLGYLEQGELQKIMHGSVEHISHGISASGTWVKLAGKGAALMREQNGVYLIDDDNLLGGKVEKLNEVNRRVYVRTILLPDLRPGDTVDFHSKNLGFGLLRVKPDSVIHIFRSDRAVTRFTFDSNA
jgi:hypothetical protein